MTLPRRELLPIPAPMPHHFRVLLMMMVQLPEPPYPLAQPLARALLLNGDLCHLDPSAFWSHVAGAAGAGSHTHR